MADDKMESPTPVTDVEKRINDVIDDIQGGKVSRPDKTRLRGAIDKSEAPLVGRPAADASIGRISNRGGL